MAHFLPGLALSTILTQASHVPSATLVRSLKFRVVALSRAAGEITFTVVSVASAPAWGAAAIVAGNLARALVTSSLLIARSSKAEWMHPVAVRWQTFREALAFGGPLTISSLAETVATYGDNLLMSRLFGPKVMGQYNLAYNLASTPTGQISENIGDVLLPSFARMDREQRRRALPRAVGLMALVLFPLAVGLAAVAPTAVTALLDSRWADLAPMLEILCTLALPYPVIWLTSALLTAEGRTRILMSLTLFKAAMVLTLILTVGRAGPLWACGGVALAFSLYGVAYLVAGRRFLGLHARPLIVATVRPFLASATMYVSVVACRAALVGAGLHLGVSLALEVAVGATAYLGAAFLLARPELLELTALARSVLGAKTGS